MGMFSQAQLAQFRRLSADISGVDGSVSGLSNDVAGLSSDVAGLSSDVGALSSTAATQQDLLDLAGALAALLTPVGAVECFARAAAPGGWLACDGAAVSRTTYADLFAAIGTAFGAGDGSTTFTLPDLRGEFVRGLDSGRGVDAARVLGTAQDWATGAPKTKSAAAGRLLKDGTTNANLSTYPNTALGFARTTSATDPLPHSSVGGSIHDLSDNEPDLVFVANGDAETRPRNVALLYCIKY